MSSLQEHIARHERAEGGSTMSEQDEVARLIEYARGADIGGDPLVVDLVQTILSQQQRIRELEQDRDLYKGLWERLDKSSEKHYENLIQDRLDAEDELEEQLAARDAVIAKVRGAADRAERGALRWADPLPVPEWVERVRGILDAAPESVLAERDAEKWVDPKPWWYPASQSRTAHKLPQTNAVRRPRTRAEYEADEHGNGATHEHQ